MKHESFELQQEVTENAVQRCLLKRGSSDNIPNGSSGAVVSREKWAHKTDFVLSLIGYAVGVSNLWRFPYLCLRNGGGAFLIPYFIFLLLCGIPLFYLEVCLGQFSGTSSMFVWKLCPLFKGIGYGMVIVSGMACIYYNAVLSWILFYLGSSFISPLPWTTCGNWWNTASCVGPNTANYTEDEWMPAYNTSLLNSTVGKSAAEEFWKRRVLRLSSGLEDTGTIQWHLAVCLFAAWIIVFLCIVKGVKTIGKVVYVTALLPYVLLTIFLIRGALLPGAREGVIFYIQPDFTKLGRLEVWIEACLQVFYSLGPAWGGLITMASFNEFHNNCLRDSIIVSLADGLTSFYGGFVIFSVLGYKAHMANTTVDLIATQGPGLAMVVYAETITKLPVPNLWAFIFFLMLLTLGIDSQFGMFETVVSGMLEAFPRHLTNHRVLLTACLIIVSYLFGLSMTTEGGFYVFNLLDWFISAFCVLTISFLECLIIGWIYGVERFCDDIELMVGRRPGLLLKVCWVFVTPILMMLALIFTIAKYKMPEYDGYQYPYYARGIGFLLSLVSILPIPVMAVWEMLQHQGSFMQRLRKSVQPASDWKPSLSSKQDAYLQQEYKTCLLPFVEREPKLRNHL